jgi:hypothetical protein
MSEPAPDKTLAEAEQIMLLREEISDLRGKFDELLASHNAVGENIAWLVANTQGVFQMLNNPEMMTKMMGTLMGGGKSNG